MIDPNVGAPQADIFYHYKNAIRQETATQRAIGEEEKRAAREERAIDPENIDLLTKKYLRRLPYKSISCRFHSFVVYFSTLQRLEWVEPTGQEEPSSFQDNYPAGPPRKYFRLTDTGRLASVSQWKDPIVALYHYPRERRSAKVAVE